MELVIMQGMWEWLRFSISLAQLRKLVATLRLVRGNQVVCGQVRMRQPNLDRRRLLGARRHDEE